ncbi:hypothetical protein POL68_09225 [Stigmatella sp. ncwal1]|uniref:Lipoprotein n=1 Tax=Stigmatella ashevillensis TaxID=2995309 RepID=A0ABT5D723_9BACT|nr:hypothetical protein [Stigmatella ashevillena]MDC0708648.1 hypothetical protein [Stigmatella ashevillena]
MRVHSVFVSLSVLLSACASKQVPPLQQYVLGMGRAEYRDYGGAKALCEAEPRWLTDELSSINGVLSRFLSNTESAHSPEALAHTEHLALLEEASRTLGPVLEIHDRNLRALPTCGFHRTGAFPDIARRGAALVKDARARLEGASGALAAAELQQAQQKWEVEAPAREAQAKQTWCSANAQVGSGDLYFARQYPNGRIEWLFCDGLMVEQLPEGEPTLVTPEWISRRDRRRIQPRKYLDAAKAYPSEEIDRRPGSDSGAGTEAAAR